MSKKLYVLISLMLVAMFVLSACQPAAPAATEAPAAEMPATEAPAAEVATEAPAATEPEPMTISLWTKEGEADGGYQYVVSLTDAFAAENPGVTFEVVNKEVETLREDFQTSSLAGAAPDLLWTVNDHAGPFTAADLDSTC